MALGLFDYLRKSRSQGFVVSLSGGADSSAVSCLVALMVELAYCELGDEAFQAGLRHIAGLAEAKTHPERVRRLLHCVYQATANSSAATRHSATTLAAALGAEMSCLEIDRLVEGYVSGIERVLGRSLTWQTDDIALQNIQARVAAPSVWLLANVKNALLLSTSNRSEAAVGYATMDGDTCGGLSPIAGIDKAFLLDWLRWLETEGPMGLHPIPALATVNRLQPTAELRPPAAGQTDEDDLMPYRVLDAIERAAIRDKQTAAGGLPHDPAAVPAVHGGPVASLGRAVLPALVPQPVEARAYAPSFHLDDENLDPKTWCRFPILSGGFERELEELNEYVAGLK